MRKKRTRKQPAAPRRGLAAIALSGLAAGAAIVLGAFWAAGLIGDGDGEPSQPPADPDELGEEVFTLYAAMLQDLEPLVAGRPDAEAIRAPVQELRDRYAERFQELGDEVDDLDDQRQRDARFAYESELFNSASGIQEELGWYSAAVDHYADTAPELSNLLEELSYLPYHAFAGQLNEDERRQLGLE